MKLDDHYPIILPTHDEVCVTKLESQETKWGFLAHRYITSAGFPVENKSGDSSNWHCLYKSMSVLYWVVFVLLLEPQGVLRSDLCFIRFCLTIQCQNRRSPHIKSLCSLFQNKPQIETETWGLRRSNKHIWIVFFSAYFVAAFFKNLSNSEIFDLPSFFSLSFSLVRDCRRLVLKG